MIEEREAWFLKNEKFKNGRIITSMENACKYRTLKNSLSEFTLKLYGAPLSRYYFTDIDRKLLLDYTLFLEKRGGENGNRVEVSVRIYV